MLQNEHLISDHLTFTDSVDIGGYLEVGYLKTSVSTLSYFFRCFFLLCKLYRLGLYIIRTKNKTLLRMRYQKCRENKNGCEKIDNFLQQVKKEPY